MGRVNETVTSLSILSDLKVARISLDPTLFPNVPSTATVHSGFAQDQAQ